MKALHMIRLSIIPLLVGLGTIPPCHAFEWNGSSGPDFSAPSNWTGKPPAANSVNSGDLFIANAQNSPLVYSEADGKTFFECADFKVSRNNRGGELKISGGELTVASTLSLVVGQNNNQTSTLTLTGGKLVLNSRDDAKPGERNFRIGNGPLPHTKGILNMSGGILVINPPGTAELGGFIIANDGASGRVTLTGGILVVASRYGTAFQPLNGRGVGILTFGQGDGVFMQTDSKQIIFGQGGGSASYIDFLAGSRGQLSLNEATEEDYVAWVKAGKIRLNGQPTTPDKFRFINLPPQGIYLLATPYSLSVRPAFPSPQNEPHKIDPNNRSVPDPSSLRTLPSPRLRPPRFPTYPIGSPSRESERG
ncbi:MAG TPA: hypothetical protein VK968_03435 [Roseimicrobium sp.]|nr:hypothetical protein [Roseimicrobium sp.]